MHSSVSTRTFAVIRFRILICTLVAVLATTGDAVVFGQTSNENSQQAMHKTENSEWMSAWAMSPHRNTVEKVSFKKQTLRQVVFLGTGGDALRIRLSNQYGPEPITIDRASVGLQHRAAQVLPESLRGLTFDSQPDVTIVPGGEVLSDPVSLDIKDNSHVAVSLFFDRKTATDGWHRRSFQRSYIIEGDVTDQARVKPQRSTTVWHWLTAIDVLTDSSRGAIVAIGDSITDGYELESGANQGWSDVLQSRLLKQPLIDLRYSVLNLGIGGNRLLHDTDELGFGQNILDRLERDVFYQSAASHVIVLAGINDIGIPVTPPEELQMSDKIRNEKVTSAQLIEGLKSLAQRARERGIGVIGATILPYAGAAYFTDDGERTRQAVNDWIRKSTAFDSYIDFDAAVRDPARPTRLLPAYDGGDHLHPNARGHRAMAEAIDLQVFR